MKELINNIKSCDKCELCKSAAQKVIGKGSYKPKVLFVGEAPGIEENKFGIPFVGKAGKLLDEWVKKLDLTSDDYYITNVVKCHPSENRDPTEQEINSCLSFLEQQIDLLKPKLIVALGKISFKTLVPEKFTGSIINHIGNIYDSRFGKVFIFPHPAYCLRNPNFIPPLESFKSLLSDEVKVEPIEEKIQQTVFAFNKQKAQNLSFKEMISPLLTAVHYFCRKANIRFKDINQVDVCEVDNVKTNIIFSELTQQQLQPDINQYILVNEKPNSYEFLGYYKLPSFELLPLSNIFKIEITKQEQKKMQQQPYVPLHLHTEFSIGDGYGKPEYIAKILYQQGFKACAVTDHGSLSGTIYFQKALLEQNIKPILGTEAYVIVADDKNRYHLILLAKNEIGWKHLLELQEIAVRDNFYYKPRMPFEEILSRSEGLIVLTACQDGVINKNIIEDNLERAEHYLKKLKKAFGDDLYFEVLFYRNPNQVKVNKTLINLAEKCKIKIVLTTDSHYPLRSDEKYQRAIKAISMKKLYGEAGYSDDTFCLLSDEEIKSLLKEYHNYITSDQLQEFYKNTFEVADKCNFTIKYNTEDTQPQFAKNADELLKKLTLEGLTKRTKYKYNEVKDRIDLELGRMMNKKYSNYFLIVADLVNWAKKNGIMCGVGRGSVGASLVALALGITKTVDPLKYDLLFDRFISSIRKDAPDVDMDFQDDRRDELFDYLKNKYGEKYFAKVITYSAFHGKQALRDVGRIFKIPMYEINKITNLVISRSGGDARADFCLTDTFGEFEQAKEFYKKYQEQCDIAIKLEGHIRHYGVHAAGCVITKRLISSYVPLFKLKNEIVTAFEKNELEKFNLVKLDILGLKTLSVVADTIRLVKQRTEKEIRLPTTFDDKKVYDKVFKNGKTIGVFQAETVGMQRLSKQLAIDNFKLLYHSNALYRPGSLHSGEASEYILRHTKQKKWHYDHSLLEPITKDTLGIIMFQEQVMQIMHSLGGFSWATAESSRKIITKSQGKKEFDKLRDEFTTNAIKLHNLKPEEAKRIFDVVCTFGSYGFNKIHAIEYSILSYYTAWLKTYYPAAFFCALLSREADENKIADYVKEAKDFGAKILTPDVNKSKAEFVFEGDSIIAGLNLIKGLGGISARKIIKYQPYNSVGDLIKKAKPSISIFRALIFAGALDSLELNRKYLYENAEVMLKNRKDKKLTLTKLEDWDEKTKAQKQLQIINFPTGIEITELYKNPFRNQIKIIPIGDLKFTEFVNELWVEGIVTFINFKQEGLEGSWTMFDNILERRYAHLNLSDGNSVLIHLSPEVYTFHKKLLEQVSGFPILVKGSSIPNYNKVYCSALIPLENIDYNSSIVKYIKDRRIQDLKRARAENPNYEVDIIKNIKYKVSKNKKAYCRVTFCDKDDRDSRMIFQLDSDIFIAGEILVYDESRAPFINVIKRIK